MMQMLKLPSEMKEEILYRLPLESLAKLRCVCKHFNTMILDERFIFKTLSHPCKHQHGVNDQLIICHNRYLSSIIINDDDGSPSLTIKDLTLVKGHPIVAVIKVYKVVHCQGLLLCVMDNQLLLWNPLLRETAWLKCGSDFHCHDDAYCLGYISNHINNYRILRFRCPNNSRNRPARVEVYASSTKTWNVMKHVGFDDDWFIKLPLSVLSFCGTPYCIGLRRRGGGRGGGGDDHHLTAFLQSFDFCKEKFQPIDGLPFLYDELNPIALEIYKRDHISVLEQCHVTRKICIWFKSRLSSPWTILMVVDIPHFPKLHPLSSRVSASYFIDEKNRLVITCLELDIGPIQIYKVVGNELRRIETNGVVGSYLPFSCTYNPV